MDGETLYKTYRPLLLSIAYRLLGSVVDAEDAVQEAFLAWNERAGLADVESERAVLCRILVHKCADRIRPLERRRETYVGPWLPEPWVEEGASPEDASLRQETLHTAYLLLLQRLRPIERIVLVLREAFHFEYDEIATIVGKSPVNCRQILHRARSRILRSGASSAVKSLSAYGDDYPGDYAHRLATSLPDVLPRTISIGRSRCFRKTRG